MCNFTHLLLLRVPFCFLLLSGAITLNCLQQLLGRLIDFISSKCCLDREPEGDAGNVKTINLFCTWELEEAALRQVRRCVTCSSRNGQGLSGCYMGQVCDRGDPRWQCLYPSAHPWERDIWFQLPSAIIYGEHQNRKENEA